MEAGKRSINDIFNGNKILEIPFFQRSYVWDESQWSRFLEDMEDVSFNNRPYFMGSIILKQQLTSSGKSIGDKRTIIDGQQRITTLCLFFKVISLRIQNSYLASIFRLPLHNNEIALLHNHNDEFAFNRILNLNEEVEIDNDDNISRAYMYFSEKIDICKIEFQNILTNLMFVGIDLGIDEDEQQIFDTINSLGVRLTTSELLKNYLFSRKELDLFKSHWLLIFEKDEDTKTYWDSEAVSGRQKRTLADIFFSAFLQIKIQSSELNVSAKDKEQFTKVSGLFDSYKKLIQDYNIDKKELLKEIKSYAKIFFETFNLDVVQTQLTEESGLDRMNAIIFGLENTTLIPYVLFIQKNAIASEAIKIFIYLESYFLRRIVCRASTKNYNQLFGERLIANSILNKSDLKAFLDARSDQTNFMPSDDELLEGFLNSKLSNFQAKGVLYFIESKIRSRAKHSTALLGIKDYSLEHIMPKKWENNWPIISDDVLKTYRNRIILTLGNLTIITSSLNSSIRDADWATKKNGHGYKLGLVHYSSGLDTFSSYLSNATWDETLISRRANFLAQKAREIWPVI